jgi:hypothetical protein
VPFGQGVQKIPARGKRFIKTFLVTFLLLQEKIIMKNRIRRYCTLFLLVCLISLAVFQTKVVGQEQPGDRMGRPAFAQVRIEKLQQAAQILVQLAVEPLPENLTENEKMEATNYIRWLIKSSRKLDDLARRWQDAFSTSGMVKSLSVSQKQMEEVNMSFSPQYSALRDELSNELRQYAMISDIMKSSYDTAQSSINNLR